MRNLRPDQDSIREKMQRFETACKAAGLKLTHQRLEIFRELVRAKDHPAAETLHRRLQKRIPTLSLDTIYRTLASLEQHGLICRVNTMESQARFEADSGPHHHMVCTRCREIVDFQWDAFDDAELPGELSGWGRLTRRNVTLHGVCSKCLESD
jgi:Fur family transcriptional regulator, peroxide stress response regulator